MPHASTIRRLLAAAILIGSLAAAFTTSADTLWVNVTARYLSDPKNDNYQAPALEGWNADTGVRASHDTRAADDERELAAGSDGYIYLSTTNNPSDIEIRVYDQASGSYVDSFGSWKGGVRDMTLDANGDLWILIAGRYLNDPQNPNYQEPMLEQWNTVTRTRKNAYARDDAGRKIVAGPDGKLYVNETDSQTGGSIIKAYSAADGSYDRSLGGWNATIARGMTVSPAGDLWILVAGRYLSDPDNPLYQAPVSEQWSIETDTMSNRYARPESPENQLIAIDSNGDIYEASGRMSGSPSDLAQIHVYLASNPDVIADSFASWTASPRDIAFVPEPGSALLQAAALAGLTWLRRRRQH